MKKLGELGISPAPWSKSEAVLSDDIVSEIIDANGNTVAQTLTMDYKTVRANNDFIAAAPKLYGKAYEVAENLLVHLAVPSQTISMNRAEVAAMVKDLQSALTEAAGETEVK